MGATYIIASLLLSARAQANIPKAQGKETDGHFSYVRWLEPEPEALAL